ncbi:hypothetical protein EJP67_33085 [Variovorax guangxiensis]|uniref:Uncharacterized protein n=1 Tax=Variovorax guangxiensis TaxID=1775474 RepID=A0A433MVK4_9BURK|nr:hypothetical protein [Variovorax guangxiensis]RUR71893.1 hypothetical protein EJP67_33085 [Variovorax guangxiensis]
MRNTHVWGGVAAMALVAVMGCTKVDSEVVRRTETTNDKFEFKPPAAAPAAPASAPVAPAPVAPPAKGKNKEFEYKPNPKYFPEAAKKAGGN